MSTSGSSISISKPATSPSPAHSVVLPASFLMLSFNQAPNSPYSPEASEASEAVAVSASSAPKLPF